MNKFIVVLCFLLSVYLATAQDCVCVKIYKPVCAVKDGKSHTFPNECEARCRNFVVKREGPCFKKMQKIDQCTARCSAQIDVVCGQKNNKTRTFINRCWAECKKFVVIANNTCPRELFFSEIANSVKNFFTSAKENTKTWFEDKIEGAKEGAQVLWHKAKDGWEKCGCTLLSDFEAVALKTYQIAHDTWAQVKADVREKWETLKSKAQAIINKAKATVTEWANKVKDLAHRSKTWFIEKGQAIKEKGLNLWHKVHDSWEECTCSLISKTKEIITKIENEAIDAANRAKAKLEQFASYLKESIVLIVKEGQENIEAGLEWLNKLRPCLCTRDFIPVCVQVSETSTATMLNLCYAKCASLKVTQNGACDEDQKRLLASADFF